MSCQRTQRSASGETHPSISSHALDCNYMEKNFNNNRLIIMFNIYKKCWRQVHYFSRKVSVSFTLKEVAVYFFGVYLYIVFLQDKVSKGAKIRNRYNQVPHLTQDTNGKVTNSQ